MCSSALRGSSCAGTVTGVDRALVTDLANSPQHFYTNLHTAQFPGGAVHGQLFNSRHHKTTASSTSARGTRLAPGTSS